MDLLTSVSDPVFTSMRVRIQGAKPGRILADTDLHSDHGQTLPSQKLDFDEKNSGLLVNFGQFP
jgi:hypothetical protein